MVRDVNRERLTDFYTLVRWSYVRSKVSPLRQSGRLFLFGQSFTDHHDAQKRLSPCVVLEITLWKLIDHWLIWSWNLKQIAQNPRVFARKLVWFVDRYKSYVSDNVYPFGTDREVVRYLPGVKHLTKSGTCHLFFETYHFSIRLESPLIYVTESGIPNSERDWLSV
jgi:hypothetical protein